MEVLTEHDEFEMGLKYFGFSLKELYNIFKSPSRIESVFGRGIENKINVTIPLYQILDALAKKLASLSNGSSDFDAPYEGTYYVIVPIDDSTDVEEIKIVMELKSIQPAEFIFNFNSEHVATLIFSILLAKLFTNIKIKKIIIAFTSKNVKLSMHTSLRKSELLDDTIKISIELILSFLAFRVKEQYHAEVYGLKPNGSIDYTNSQIIKVPRRECSEEPFMTALYNNLKKLVDEFMIT